MNHSATTALLGPEFDGFLFASVDHGDNGKSFSVLSALAQSDLDPWREAAELARMPREAAKQRLAALISDLPSGAVPPLLQATIADRLVKLLPRGTVGPVVSGGTRHRSGSARRYRTIINIIVINVLVMAGVLFAQWALEGLQPSQSDMAGPAGARAVVPQTSQADRLSR